MEFRCRLGTPTGEIVEQTFVAESESRLRHELEEKGLYILAIRAHGLIPGLRLDVLRRRRVAQHEFLVFNQELATLLKAGMPLVQSLDILRRRVENPTFKAVLDDVHDRVKAGAALSEAFEQHADLFPGIYTASLLAGEKSGGLEQVLRRYVTYVKVISGVKSRTLSALIYPMVLVVLSLVVVGVLVIRVVPAFGEFYHTFGRELPLATRMIVAVSGVVAQYWIAMAAVVAAASGATYVWATKEQNRARLHWLLLRVPLLGHTALKFSTSQLARTLATLLGGGIPLVNAITVAARALGNRYLAAEFEIVGQRVREGESLAGAMTARGVFPDVAVKMIEVGESTGALQDMLNSMADFYDEEIETTLGRFATIIGPVLLVVMGLVIAALLLALYLPVFQLSSVVS